MPLTEIEMEAALKSLRSDSSDEISFMQETHASDHITPTHTRTGQGGAVPKSFYMKSGSVTEQQGTKVGTVGWGGKTGEVKNLVTVAGFVPCTKKDESTITRWALARTEYMMMDSSDSVGGKFLLVTGIPHPYAGFSFTAANKLPLQVHMNVICIRAAGNTRILSTYPVGQEWLNGKTATKYVVT